ncbi:hypothetical protein C8R34_1654, partial [Nitrosomonas sp. Nm84]
KGKVLDSRKNSLRGGVLFMTNDLTLRVKVD